MRRGFTLIELLVVLAIIVILVTFLGGGAQFLGQAIWYLLTGWVYFFSRNVPRADPQAEAVLTALLALALLTLVIHLLMRRFGNRPAQNGLPARHWAFRKTLALVGIVVLVFGAGISAVGVTHQTAWLATADEPRVIRKGGYREGTQAKSLDNLKQFGIAAENYQHATGWLPTGTTVNERGRLMHGWQTHLLPYLEEGPLFNSVDLTKTWDDPVNRQAMFKQVKIYMHPAARVESHPDGYGMTTYAANVYALGGDQPRKLADFTRGMSNTILFGEANGNYKPWGYPLNVRDPRLGLHRSPEGFGGPIKGRTQFVMADGSLRTFTNDADPEFLELLAHPDGR
jgi:prepilin-type N-terminal cleavage/methylation domain-containing protein